MSTLGADIMFYVHAAAAQAASTDSSADCKLDLLNPVLCWRLNRWETIDGRPHVCRHSAPTLCFMWCRSGASGDSSVDCNGIGVSL